MGSSGFSNRNHPNGMHGSKKKMPKNIKVIHNKKVSIPPSTFRTNNNDNYMLLEDGEQSHTEFDIFNDNHPMLSSKSNYTTQQ